MNISNKHAINIATKGMLSGDAKLLSLKGNLLSIMIDEIPIYYADGGVDLIYGKPKKYKNKKIIRITVVYFGKKFVEERIVDDNVKITTNDIKVDLIQNKLKITIKNIDDSIMLSPWNSTYETISERIKIKSTRLIYDINKARVIVHEIKNCNLNK